MATWGLHMRIAEGLLKRGYDLDIEKFLIGNIGPDCGSPNEDWSAFDPPKSVSHWMDEDKNICADKFYEIHLKKVIADKKEKAFLVGYYSHLLTDIKFSELVKKKRETDDNYKRLNTDRKFIWTIKEDWYDLDHLYFRENPNSLFFTVFQKVKSFPDYLEYYPEGSISRQVKYITDFYQNPSENLDREYIYLTMKEMDDFIEKTLDYIDLELKKKFDVVYRELGKDEICIALFKDFNRYQDVKKCWRKENEKWIIKEVEFIEKWGEEEFKYLVECLINTIEKGGCVLGAFQDGMLVGFAALENILFGSNREYLELSSLHTSYEKRGMGIGKKLISLIKEKAISMGAKKLYISAHSSVESQAFYKAVGCNEAAEYNKRLVEKEPCDCQLECCLTYDCL